MRNLFATSLRLLCITIFMLAVPAAAMELWDWQVDNPKRDGDEVTVQIVDTSSANKYQVNATYMKIAENPGANPRDIVVRLVYIDGNGIKKNPRLYLNEPIVIETAQAWIVAENGGHLHVAGKLKLINP